MTSAFKGDTEVKTAAIAEATGSTAQAWAVEATDDERQACAERFGLDLSLLSLLSHAFHVPYGERAIEKLQTALTAIPVGADSLAIVRSWVLQIWECADGLKKQVQGTPLQQPAQEVVELVRRSAIENLSRDVWRRARACVNKVASDHEALAPLAELITAMGWDLKSSPRAVVDIWNAWSESVSIPLNNAAGFPKHLQDEVFDVVRESHVAASVEVGRHDPTKESAAAHQQRSAEVVQRLVAERGYGEIFDAMQRHFGATLVPALQAWHARAERSVTEACARGGV